MRDRSTTSPTSDIDDVFSFSTYGRRKRKEYRDLEDEDEGRSAKKARETIVLDDSEDYVVRGIGSARDPISFRTWSTGNVIVDDEAGDITVISDDEDDGGDDIGDETLRTSRRSSSPIRWRRPSIRGSNRQLIHDPVLSSSRSPRLYSSSEDSAGEDNEDEEQDFEDHEFGAHETKDQEDEQDEDEDAVDEEENDDDEEEDQDDADEDHEDEERYNNSAPNYVCDDEIPGLGYSQETMASEQLASPIASQEKFTSPKAYLKSNAQDVKGSIYQEAREAPIRNIFGLDRDPNSPYQKGLRARKRLALSVHVPEQMEQLRIRMDRHLAQVIGDRGPEECWLFAGRAAVGSRGAIPMPISFAHEGVREIARFNIGFVCMLIEGLMTDAMKEGIIEHEWTASHLCGNYTCLNPQHITAEHMSINQNRNSCFENMNRSCSHTPPCIKHLKLKKAALQDLARQRLYSRLSRDEVQYHNIRQRSASI